MKKMALALFGLVLFLSAFAQTDQQYIRPSSIGFSYMLYDFVTPQRIHSSSLSAVLREKQLAKIGEMGTGLAFSYFKGLRNKIDFASTIALATANYRLKNSLHDVNASLLVQADASLQFKMVPDRYFLVPYLSAGIGANKYGAYYGAFMPLGVGFRLNFFNEASLFVNARYAVPVTDETVRSHFTYGFGLSGVIGGHKSDE